ncbi:MAG: aldo/keto reductase [Oscillospiraceae bacterium]|jgi:predicted aldo/keto reductase-like oxidoreductase|nr:aldo/keto reductase [Oscillospiraceae bacterium]
MQYRQFGRLKDKVSPLGFGMMRLPTRDGAPFSGEVMEDETIAMLRYAVDNGVNYVDTAYPYHSGQSEVVTGKALRDGYRAKVKLATKSPVFLIREADDFDRLLEEQLRRLGDEHIDYYLLHALSGERWTDIVLRHDLLTKAERAKQAGKIGHIGFSYHDSHYENFLRIVDGYDGWEFCQIQLNYLDTENQAGLAGLRYAAARGLGVVVMEPLLGGKLASPPAKVRAMWESHPVQKSPVAWALDWLWDMPEVSLLLSGMSDMRQTRENVAYAKAARVGMLTPEDAALMARVQTVFKAVESIPCTGCAYCMPCPSGVDIPGNFDAYNVGVMFEDTALARTEYDRIPAFGGPSAQAASCTGCAACESKCPQGIGISRWMSEIREMMGT